MEKQCQVDTIKGYRSIISNTLKFKSGYVIASHFIISELVKSFRSSETSGKSHAPKWGVSFVLSHICKAPFEPMHASGLDFRIFDGFNLKTCLLMRW